jgi:hypothetical protein
MYENREQLNREHGGLQQELSTVRHAWIMWPVGGSSVSLPNEALRNVERLILRDPNKSSDWYAKHFISGSSEILKTAIADLTKRARNVGVAVRWNEDFDFSIIIDDHVNDQAWARVELLLPGIESAYRPNVLIRKMEQPSLFETFVKMYEYIWNESTLPPS